RYVRKSQVQQDRIWRLAVRQVEGVETASRYTRLVALLSKERSCRDRAVLPVVHDQHTPPIHRCLVTDSLLGEDVRSEGRLLWMNADVGDQRHFWVGSYPEYLRPASTPSRWPVAIRLGSWSDRGLFTRPDCGSAPASMT